MANPFVSGVLVQSIETAQEELPTYKEYAWDFNKDCFIYDNGQHKIVTENEALKVWIYKVLKTERWRYQIYDNAYGIELEQFIGRRTNNSDTAGEIGQYVNEALLVNPYIKSIDKSSYDIVGKSLKYTIYLTTVYGTLVVSNGQEK